MTYRDDLDAAKARVAELEQELAATRAELATARHRQSEALARVEGDTLALRGEDRKRSVTAALLGAPARLVLVRRVEAALPRPPRSRGSSWR